MIKAAKSAYSRIYMHNTTWLVTNLKLKLQFRWGWLWQKRIFLSQTSICAVLPIKAVSRPYCFQATIYCKQYAASGHTMSEQIQIFENLRESHITVLNESMLNKEMFNKWNAEFFHLYPIQNKELSSSFKWIVKISSFVTFSFQSFAWFSGFVRILKLKRYRICG